MPENEMTTQEESLSIQQSFGSLRLMSKKMFFETELAALAKEVREKSGKRKADVARELKLGKPTIQQAEEYPELSLTKVRKRIIEKYSSFELVGPVFFLRKK